MNATDIEWLVPYRRGALCGAYVGLGLSALAGVSHRTGIEALATLAFGAGLLFWCTLDAHIHGKSFDHGLALPLMFTLPVGIAFYLVWTRGWRGLLSYAKSVGLAVAIVAGASFLASRL